MVDQLTEEGEGAEYRRRLKIKIAGRKKRSTLVLEKVLREK